MKALAAIPVLVILSVFLPSCFAPQPLLTDLSLQWREAQPPAVPFLPDSALRANVRLRINAFADRREMPARIGRNIEAIPDAEIAQAQSQGKTIDAIDNGRIRWVTTKDNAGVWCANQLGSYLARHGITLDSAQANLIIDGEILELFVEEKSKYNTSCRMQISISSAQGESLWKGIVSSRMEQIGRSYSAENYYQNISDVIAACFDELLKGNALSTAADALKRDAPADTSAQ